MSPSTLTDTTTAIQARELKHRIVDLKRIKTGLIHVHMCGCGDYFVCRAHADKCAVPDPYQCDNCAQDQMDAYFQEQERTREPQQSDR